MVILLEDCSVAGACSGCPNYYMCHDDDEYPIGSYDWDDDNLPFEEFKEKWGEK